ncbi:adenosine deaminase [Serratia marcescens]|uniref:Adenosine deaminase n=1 Tax=Serratia marcescens TaxID=615 RepID=A0A939NLQ7_SERMA|nr:adenosine deaminase [Serratia marcescens]
MIDPRLPLTDIHRHLDGNIRAQTILDLGRQFNLALPATIWNLRPHVQIAHAEPDLVSFLQKLDWGIGGAERSGRLPPRGHHENVRRRQRRPALRRAAFSPYYMAMKHQLPVAGVVEAVIDGIRSGLPRSRHRHSPDRHHEAAPLARPPVCRNWKGCWRTATALPRWIWRVELGFPAACSSTTLTARATPACASPCTRAAAGPESIWQAIRELGAEAYRSQGESGRRSGTDGLRRNTASASNLPDLNIRLAPCLRWRSIRWPPLHAGVLASINTDDPAVPGASDRARIPRRRAAGGLTPKEIRTAQENGLKLAFLSEQEKQALRAKVQRLTLFIMGAVTLHRSLATSASASARCLAVLRA